VPACSTRTKICAVCLFFVAAWPLGAEEAQLPAATTVAANTATDELRVLVESLSTENRRLKMDREQQETIIRLLTENLAIARTESELFQKRWSEAQLRAQSLGVNFANDSVTQAQRQLVESIRALYLAQAERQHLVEQLQRLLQAIEKQGAVAEELARTKVLLATTGQSVTEPPAASATGDPPAAGRLESAVVIEVNPSLRLVVLNVGLVQGARVGMPLVVLRGDRVVAELKIVEVRPQICGALVERVEKKVTVKAGDKAMVTKNS
jgi:hypothetical protein